MNRALLEYYMARNHLDAYELAEKIGIDRSTFSKKINGVTEFKLSEIQNMVKVLGIEDPTPVFFEDEVS